MNDAPARIPPPLRCPGDRVYDVTMLQLIEPAGRQIARVAKVNVQLREARWQNLDFLVYIHHRLIRRGTVSIDNHNVANYAVEQIQNWLAEHPGQWGLSNCERYVQLVCDGRVWVFVP